MSPEYSQHGLRRAVRRGLENVAIQVYLTAAVINLKRLAIASSGPFYDWFYIMNRLAMIIYKALSSLGTKYSFSVGSLYVTA